MTEPYFCDGHSPIAQDWYESRTKSELGELVAELASRLYEIGMPEADEIAECNSDAKHFGKWIRMVRRVEGQLAPYREGMFRDGGEDECANRMTTTGCGLRTSSTSTAGMTETPSLATDTLSY